MFIKLKVNPEVETELKKAEEMLYQVSKILFELKGKLLVAEEQPTEREIERSM